MLDSVYFMISLSADYDAISLFTRSLISDLVLSVPITVSAFVGLVFLTAYPLGFYQVLQS